LNEAELPKKVIEQFTYDLCHYYFNWAGPIKVPAPCMYAHKIAELYLNIMGKKKSELVPDKLISPRIFESLHYL
jgi:aubergine-like protein